MRYLVKKHYNNLTDKTAKCRFMLIMSYLLSLFLILLNLYIGYTIIQYFMGDGFSFLGGIFIGFSFVITIPVLIFSLKNIISMVEEKMHKRTFHIIISTLGILIGIVLHNATVLWIYILGFNVLLLLSCIFCKKVKIDNTKMSVLLLAISLTISLSVFPTSLSAQTNNNFQEIYLLDKNDFNPYVDFISDDIKDYFNPETGNQYPSTNLFDGYLKTCWVAGSTKTNKNSILYVKLPDKIDVDRIILNIFSGYGKNKILYVENARPHQIKLSIFAALYPEGFSTEVASLYVIKKYPLTKVLTLADTFDVQSFPLNLNKKELVAFQEEALMQAKYFSGTEYNRLAGNTPPKSFLPSFILKMEITDSYPGKKYNDVCVSEIFFNDRFITPYPDKYSQALNVYIKDDNTLLADYVDKKGVVIYKDTSSVFTYVECSENKNWAILYYTPNDEEGESSRNEELAALIDLKNRENVESKFEKCTGTSAMFQVLSKDGNGNVYKENEAFNIELK